MHEIFFRNKTTVQKCVITQSLALLKIKQIVVSCIRWFIQFRIGIDTTGYVQFPSENTCYGNDKF